VLQCSGEQSSNQGLTMAEKKRYKSPLSGMARRFSGIGGLSGSGRGVLSGIADQPVPGYSPPQGPMPLDRLAAALKPGAMRGTASSLSGLGGLSGAARGMTAGELATAVAGAPSAMASALTQMVPGTRAYSSGIGGQRSSQLTQPPRQPMMTMQPQATPVAGGTIPGLTAGLDAIIDRARIRAGGLPGGVQGPLPPTGQGLDDPRRVRAIADMYGLAGIQVPPLASQIAGAERERTFIDQLEAQRLAGRGIAAGPTQQERGQFNAAVVDRIRQSPSPINQFMGQELMGRTREGRQMGMEDLEQGYLSRPMQGGMMRGSTADTMRDRERRLAAFGSVPRDAGADLTRTRMVQDQAINDELARQGVGPEQLSMMAQERGNPAIAQGGRAAMSLLRPGTVLRGTGGAGVPFTVAIGREEPSEARERRLASLPARQGRNVQAVAERLDRMRAGRQAMMANQQAFQRQAMDMATNPISNPMLLSGSPIAQAEAMRIGQQQREFAANAPSRMLDSYEQMLRTRGLELQNQASERMMSPEFMQQQQQQQFMQDLLSITPEAMAALGPAGLRRLQQQAMGQQQTTEPQSIPDAVSTVQSLSPDVSAMLGGEDPANLTSSQLLDLIRQRQSLGLSMSPQDTQSLFDYVRSRSMYDTNFLNQ
jgi:hypothetical protein